MIIFVKIAKEHTNRNQGMVVILWLKNNMPNRKAKERKMDRKAKNLAIKKWKRNQKKLRKEQRNEERK